MVFELDHAWYVADFPSQKASQVAHRFQDIKITDLEHINFLKMGIVLKD